MLYLASISPRRKQILRELGLRFRAVKPSYREGHLSGLTPAQIVKRHAMGKALAAAKSVKSGVILAADTIVYFKKRVMGKPKNHEDAVRTLSFIQGHWHAVYTGVALLKVEKGRIAREKVFYETTRVCLKKMDKKDIGVYFKKINPLDKAGAYAIQSKNQNIIAEVKGSFSNAVGLPQEILMKQLKAFEG